MSSPGARPYWEISETVAQLKRDGRLDDALTLLTDCLDFTERSAAIDGRPLYSWPFDQAAIVLRKQKRYADEVQIIERYLRRCAFRDLPKAADRLQKACQLSGQAELREMNGLKVPYYIPEERPLAERELFIRRGLVVDAETTGLSREDELIELGAILFSFNSYTGKVKGVELTYRGRREPRVPISRDAKRIHRIHESELRGRSLDDACVRDLFSRTDIMIAHNASFDRRFIAQLYPEAARATWFCTMNGIDWSAKGLSSRKLATIAAASGLSATQEHAGLADAQLVLDLLEMTDTTTGEPYLKELLNGMGTTGCTPNNDTASPPTDRPMTIRIEVGPGGISTASAHEPAPKLSLWDRLRGKR